MTLNQLRYFCAVARNRSVTRAAQEQFVTQPTISLAIRELEKEFKLTLFIRDNNRLQLTEEGEKFYQKAVYLLQVSEEIKFEFSSIASSRRPLKIGVPPVLSVLFFPELLNDFKAEYPEIPVELDEYASVRAFELVQNGNLDLAIANLGMYDLDKLNICVLADDQLVYCVSPQHHSAARAVMKTGDFAGENVLFFNSDSFQVQMLKERFENLPERPKVLIRCSQLCTAVKFVRQGNCGCFLFSGILPQFPEFVGIPLDPPLKVRIGIVWKKGRYINTAMRSFISFTRDVFCAGKTAEQKNPLRPDR